MGPRCPGGATAGSGRRRGSAAGRARQMGGGRIDPRACRQVGTAERLPHPDPGCPRVHRRRSGPRPSGVAQPAAQGGAAASTRPAAAAAGRRGAGRRAAGRRGAGRRAAGRRGAGRRAAGRRGAGRRAAGRRGAGRRAAGRRGAGRRAAGRRGAGHRNVAGIRRAAGTGLAASSPEHRPEAGHRGLPCPPACRPPRAAMASPPTPRRGTRSPTVHVRRDPRRDRAGTAGSLPPPGLPPPGLPPPGPVPRREGPPGRPAVVHPAAVARVDPDHRRPCCARPRALPGRRRRAVARGQAPVAATWRQR